MPGRVQLNSSRPDSGIASILLLFAMSAFSVLSVAALSTSLESAPAGKSFSIFHAIPQDVLVKFVAPMVVPNDWRTEGAKGSYQFQLPVLVPEQALEEHGSSAAWHTLTEVPGMAVCCESRAGVCSARTKTTGGAPIAEWTPAAADTLEMSFKLASHPDPAAKDPAAGDVVTATVTSEATADKADGSSVSCQLEFDGAVIARGTAALRQQPRDDGSAGALITGTMTLRVKTR